MQLFPKKIASQGASRCQKKSHDVSALYHHPSSNGKGSKTVLFDLGLSGTMGSIMITMKSTLGLSGTSLVGLLRKGAQKIPGFMLVNLIPNT